MEQQQRSLIFTAAVGLIILAIIVGSIYYLVKFIQGRVASNSQTPTPSVTQIAEDFAVPSSTSALEFQSASPTASVLPTASVQTPQTGSTQGNNPVSDKKVYSGGDFQLTYPKNWGQLKCTNGKNFELDPNSPADANIVCDTAIKSVTVLVSDISGCQGEAAKVGNIEVIKSQASEDGYTRYQWCTKTTPTLNITHRVSQGGERATSKQDFSKQIEEIIASLSFSRGS